MFADLALKPTVDVVDDLGNAVSWFSVVAGQTSSRSNPHSVTGSERVLFRYLVIFNDVSALSSSLLPNAGDILNAPTHHPPAIAPGTLCRTNLSPAHQIVRARTRTMIDSAEPDPSW